MLFQDSKFDGASIQILELFLGVLLIGGLEPMIMLTNIKHC